MATVYWKFVKIKIHNKRTEYEPSQFGSSREHIATANAASNGSPTVFVWVLNVYIYCRLEEVFLNIFWEGWPWSLTFRDHLRSKIFSPFESPYKTSYLTSIDTFALSHTVFEIFDFKVFNVWPWPSEVTWDQNYFQHLIAHTWLPI